MNACADPLAGQAGHRFEAAIRPMRGAALLALLTGLVACAEHDPEGVDAARFDADAVADAALGDDFALGGDGGACALGALESRLDQTYSDRPGVPARLLQLDLYARARTGCPPAPLVIWIHGGGWRVGDKGNQIRNKVKLYSDAGWIFASVNHRLSPAEPTDDPAAVRYPDHNEDVAAAVAWLLERAPELGIDPARVLIHGHSAGAGIVSQLATNPRFLQAEGLSIDVLRCAAMLDTEAYDVRSQAEAGEAIYLNAFGRDPAVWDEASALTHVAPGLAPMLVVTRGSAVRQALSARFVDALTAVGVEATLVNAEPLDHEGVNAAVGAPGDTRVTPPLMDFFRDCVR